MKNPAKKQQQGARTPVTTRKKFPIGLVSLLVVAAIATGVWLSRSKPAVASNETPPAGTAAAPVATAGAPMTEAAFEKLVGGWRRPDGGYVLLIKSVDANGKLDASYLNPRSINVARAEASLEGTTNKVFVELRDVNYPGSTYKLTYDPASDQLYGIYNQAALNQQFDVVFARMK